MRIRHSEPRIDVELGREDAVSILGDLGIEPNGTVPGGWNGPLIMLVESLREMRGDYERVGG